MKDKTILIMASVRWYNASAHYALSLAESLRQSGFTIIIFGSPGTPFVENAAEKKFEVIDDIDLLKTGLIKYLINILRFRKTFKGLNIDIINPHFSRDHVFTFLSLTGIMKKIVRTRTDSKNPKSNLLNRIFYKISAKHYTVSSNYMVRHIMRMGIPENRISVIPPGINYRKFAAFNPVRNLRAELKIPNSRIVVSFIGRLDKIKGVEYFIRSYPRLKNKNKFHYIVSGEEINISIEDLKELAYSNNISNISFLERLEEVRDILTITDIGVIPSIGSESICRIGLEMLSFSIPVIGSNINSIPEIISGYGGIVVTPGSSEEIATALDYLADEKNYRKIKTRIKAGIKTIAPDRLSAEYADIF